MDRSIFRFSLSTEDALSYVLAFTGLDLDGRSLRVRVKDRATSMTRATLTIGAGLTVSGNEVSAAVAKVDMASWPRGEYSADLVDITGEPSTIMAVRFIYDLPGNLVYGVKDRKAFVTWSDAKAYVTATGAVGPPGPPGYRGWAPEFAAAADGERRVLQVIDWIGGTGEKPDITGYLGAAGIVADIEDAIDVRGAAGADGEDGTNGTDGTDGNNGWSPVLAVASDGARRVLQVADWVGGEGAKPATGDYIGFSGLTPTIGDAVDIRGPAGTATIVDGDKGDITTSDDGETWEINAGAVGTTELVNDGVTNAKLANMAASTFKGRATASTGDPEDLTATQATSLLDALVGDSGSGGTKGLVPAPAAGDAAAGKVLGAGGTWVPQGVQTGGQCRLILSGGSLLLQPRNGNRLRIGSTLETVPDPGVTLAATGLTSGTLYYIYAYMSGSTMTLEASTTSYAVSSTTGMPVKSGDATRTLVGMVRPVTGPAFVDSASQRFVRSWFNDPRPVSSNIFTTDRTFTSPTTPGEIHSEIRIEALVWAGETWDVSASGYMSNSNVAATFAGISFDGAAYENGVSAFHSAGAGYLGPLGPRKRKTGLSEGYHYATLFGLVTSGTGTYAGSSNGNRVELSGSLGGV